MRWLELACRVDGEAVEAVSEVFARVATGGVAIEPELVSGADDGAQLSGWATVKAYLPLNEQATEKRLVVDEALWHLRAIWPVGDLAIRELADEDWATAWKRHYSTFRVGRRLVIHPSWLPNTPRSDDVVVTLDPGSAFGTGLHPTTRRCLELLEETVKPGHDVLDVGTGSGILALAAVGLGARHVLATDVDPLAVEVARTNVQVNRADEVITVMPGSIDVAPSDRRYDVVVANIIARVIIQLASELVARLRPEGQLIVGGIIADRAEEVSETLARHGVELARFADGDWVTLLGRPRRTR